MDTAFLFIAISAAGWILLIVGLLFQRRWLRKQEQERTRATGVVVDYANSPHCTPVVEFTAEGQTLRLPCKGVFEREKYPIGQTLDILYNADDPTSFHPDNAEEPAVGRGLMRFGLVWIVIAVLLTAALIGPIKGSVKRPEPKRPSMLTPAPTLGRSPWGSAEGFGYALDENGFATLTGYTGSDSDVTLPILIDGHIVSGISQSAFTGNRRLARVTVPGSMRAVPSGGGPAREVSLAGPWLVCVLSRPSPDSDEPEDAEESFREPVHDPVFTAEGGEDGAPVRCAVSAREGPAFLVAVDARGVPTTVVEPLADPAEPSCATIDNPFDPEDPPYAARFAPTGRLVRLCGRRADPAAKEDGYYKRPECRVRRDRATGELVVTVADTNLVTLVETLADGTGARTIRTTVRAESRTAEERGKD